MPVGYRVGESVRISIQGVDDAGQIMSETVHTLFGFDNPGADAVYQAVVDALQGVFADFNKVKNSGAKG